MKLFAQSAQFPEPENFLVRSGQIPMTFSTNSLMTVSFSLSIKTGSVSNWSTGTSSSSPPAGRKYVDRKSCSSVLLVTGLVSFSYAARTSSRGRRVGLALQPSAIGYYADLGSTDCRMFLDLHVHKGLGVGERMGELNALENIALAVQWRVTGSYDGAIDEEAMDNGG